MKGYIVHPTYNIIDNEPIIHLYGRLENGKSFLSRHKFRPYFYVREKDKHIADKHGISLVSSEMCNFSGEPMVKINANLPKDVPELRRLLESFGVPTFESDIPFAHRFLLDYNIRSTIDIDGVGIDDEFVDVAYDDSVISSVRQYNPSLRMLSIDIETDMAASVVNSIALFWNDGSEVMIVSSRNVSSAQSFQSEKMMLSAFVKRVNQIDPDIITGWNLIDFDFKILQKRMRHHDIIFAIGRDGEECRLTIQHDFMRTSTAKLTGRVVLDGINLLKLSNISLESYKLDNVARDLIGEGKKDIGSDPKVFDSLIKTDPEKLAEYNLQDARLVYRILIEKNIIDLTIQKSIVTGLPLDRVQGSVAALDMLYIAKAKKRGIVCPTSSFADTGERVKGAFVMEPKPGIYEHILVLDFKSLYPSIIRTFNIDPLSYSPEGTIIAPNGARFKKENGILQEIIPELFSQRDAAKKSGNLAESYALKIILNSFYGVLANTRCRFYNLHMANAITSYAREIVQESAEIIREMGYPVIYGDTDSVFVVSGEKDYEKAMLIGKHLQETINKFYDKKNKDIGQESFLDLEFEKLYKVFMIPKIRGAESGAKKRYAGLIEKNGKDSIDVTGMEFVRSDWTEVAKTFQIQILEKVFHKKPIEEYIRTFVSDLRKGQHDSQLIYRKSIRKELESYTKTTPPHVKAARQLDKIESPIIEYLMTRDGPQPIQKIRSSVDYDHYINKQLKPIADSILSLFDKDFEMVVNNTKQKSLMDF